MRLEAEAVPRYGIQSLHLFFSRLREARPREERPREERRGRGRRGRGRRV